MKNISLKDIAARAKVSTTTVSFVLNGKATEKRISKAVTARVKAIVKELDYKPNQMARGLRTGTTKTLGLMIEDISNPFFAKLAKTIEDEADQYNYDVVFCSTEDKDKRASKLLQTLRYRQVDGYILTPTIGLRHAVDALLKEEQPLVLIDRYFPSLASHYVIIDNFQGAYCATEHLLKNGYRNIAIVTTASRQLQMEKRREGFIQALRDQNLKHSKRIEMELPFNEQESLSIKKIKDFLKKTKPDAVFFFTNYLALFGLQAIRQLKWKIPEEIGMISFDDHDVFSLYDPPISCISQPISRIGRKAVSILMKAIQKQDHPMPLQYVLEPELTIRASCRETVPHSIL